MNMHTPMITREAFEARLAEFIPALDAFVAKYRPGSNTTHEIERGPKYIRVVQVSYGQRSAYCFLDYQGRIWKPKGWKGPELKNSRGDIFEDNFALGKGLTPYGTSYLR